MAIERLCTIRDAHDNRRPSEPGAGRIHGLDGLRAVAVLVVLAFHLWPTKISGGFIGVDLFFVISGFLITTLLLRERSENGRIKLGEFWNRRARRLLPALILVLFSTLAAAGLVNADLLVGIQRQVLGAVTFTTNWIEIAAGSDYFADSHRALFVTFWSLAAEEQFYLFWPLLLTVIFLKLPPVPRAITALVLATLSASLMAWWLDLNAVTRVYYGTHTHSFGFMIGAALAFAIDGSGSLLTSRWWRRLRPPMGFVAVAGIVTLAALMDSELPSTYRGGLVLASALSAAAVAALLGGPSMFSRVCQLRPIAWIGERSYGIYLWHWPVLLIVNAAVEHLTVRRNSLVPSGVIPGVAATLTCVLSDASFRWVEKPIQNNGLGKTWALARIALGTPRKMAGTGAAIVLTLLVFHGAAFAVISAPSKSQAQLSVEAGEQAIKEQNSRSGNGGVSGGRPSTGNRYAWPTDQPLPTGDRIVGFGDSVMAGAAPAMFARFPGIVIDAKPNRQWQAAPALVQQVIDRGAMRSVVILNFGTNAGFTNPRSEVALRNILTTLGPSRRVVLVNTVGVSKWVPAANATLQKISTEYPNTVVADWYSKARANPDLLYKDQTHPNVKGIMVYADTIAEALTRLLR